MNLWRFCLLSLYYSYQGIYLCIKSIWYLSFLCSFQGLLFLYLLGLSYNSFTNYINSYLDPIYDYFEITELVPSHKDVLFYITCSTINCEHPYIDISQMLLGWKPVNQTLFLEILNINITQWIKLFGKSIGKGMIDGFKSDVIHFFSRFQDISPIYYLEN